MLEDKERAKPSGVGGGTGDSQKSPLGYKGSVSGLKGLLSNRIAEGIANVVNSLEGSSTERSQSPVNAGSTRKIPIDQIYPCPDQPRQVFDPRSLEELSQTMKELGQAQAITVRKTAKGYEIISGERRYRAAKLAGLSQMDCLVKEVSGPEGRLLALVENIQRQDLLPIEEAQFLKKVLEENSSLSLDKLAKNLGSHKSTLSEKIQLTEIPDDLQPLLYARGQNFTHRHWRVISRISDPALLREMIKKAIDNQLSVSELERSVQALGIHKAPRRKSVRVEDSVGRVSGSQAKIFRVDGNSLRIRSLTVDLAKLTSESRNQLTLELQALLSLVNTPARIDGVSEDSRDSLRIWPILPTPSIEVG